jgi:hypothetical protein
MKFHDKVSLSAVAVAVLAIVVAACQMSCQSTFYENGQVRARITGDYTYTRSASGAETITLKHSPVIRAGGIATSQSLAAAGTAASAAMLAR